MIEETFPNKYFLMLLSRFSRVRLCATPQTAAHQAPLSLGFSRQENWSGLPFPSPMHESEKWKGSRSVMSDSSRPHELQPTRLLHPWDFPGKSTAVGCHCLLQSLVNINWVPICKLGAGRKKFKRCSPCLQGFSVSERRDFHTQHQQITKEQC